MEIMNKYLIVVGVFLFCIFLIVYTQINSKEKGSTSFKQAVKKSFPKYHIIEKHDTIIICEINYRNELDELVVIRVDPNQEKNIRMFGRRATITYKKQPLLSEIKKDAAPYLR